MQITNAFVWQPELAILGRGGLPDRPERDVQRQGPALQGARETAYPTLPKTNIQASCPRRPAYSPPPPLAPVKAQQQPPKRDGCATRYTSKYVKPSRFAGWGKRNEAGEGRVWLQLDCCQSRMTAK